MSVLANRDRRTLMAAVDRGQVTRSAGGVILYRTRHAGFNHRVDNRVRELMRAGWVRLGRDGGTYQLTDAGRAALDGAS